jgi:hypothetical protein
MVGVGAREKRKKRKTKQQRNNKGNNFACGYVGS